MTFLKVPIVIAIALLNLAGSESAEVCTSIESITCKPVTSTPTLDGDLIDWSTVESFVTPLTSALTSTLYEHGHVKIQCLYDTNQVYFAIEVPGPYRFDADNNHLCASVSTMFKMGEMASLFNMGGCPLAEAVDCESAPEGCEDYKVDIGGHWELKTTEMKKNYPINTVGGTGDDLVANKDDEYAVGPYCRFDDDDAAAGNEWAGAWLHTSPASVTRDLDSEQGSYIFEMSRLLKTASTETDAQLEAGTAIDFGVAFWDPFEMDETGWTDAGHYVTGCSRDWISLKLVDENGDLKVQDLEKSAVSKASGMFATSALAAAFALAHAAA